MNRLAPLALAAVPLLLGAKASKKPPVEGYWETVAGQVKLERSGTKVTGTLVSPAPGAKITAGAPVFQGTFVDDNLAGDVRVGLISDKCQDEPKKGFVMLLLTKSGKLTGGGSSKADCAKDVPGVTWLRADGPREVGGVLAAPAMPEGVYDPRGKRRTAVGASVGDLLRKGEELLHEGRFEEARQQFEAVVKKDPTVGEAYNGVGVTFYARQDYENAVDWYKRGLEAAPGFGDLYYNLACTYSLQDKKKMALRYLRLAATKGYTDLEAFDQDGDLDPLRKEPEFAEIRGLIDAPAPPPPE